MKAKKTLRLVLAAILIFAVAVGGWFGLRAWRDATHPLFQDANLELGTRTLSIDIFFTDRTDPEKAAFVTDPGSIDLTQAGQYPMVLRHGEEEVSVTLTVADTIPPKTEFRNLTAYPGYLPTPEEFIVSSADLSGVSISFGEAFTAPEGFGDVEVEVLATDGFGNQTAQICTISYGWIKDTTLELGSDLNLADLLYNAQDAALLGQTDISAVNNRAVGAYVVTSTANGYSCTCTVTVEDTTGPQVTTQTATVYKGQTPDAAAFVVKATDLSGEVNLELVTQPNTGTEGTKTVQIRATDQFGNETIVEATLEVIRDTEAPTVTGLTDIIVEKNTQPDYETGVSAQDNLDGVVDFSYNPNSVDLAYPGIYYVFYTATDAEGNVGTYRRRVQVGQDSEATAALVAQWAEKCPDDPVGIKNYVKNNIVYNTSWGGDDPVAYGFSKKAGNCLVHAVCLQEMLTAKGYESQIIWTTEKTHYWVVVLVDGVWWHLDGTPGQNGQFGLMSDQKRLSNLRNRVWEFDAWPVCGE